VELLKQPQYSPFPVERQVISVWLGNEGCLDDVPVEDVRRFETGFEDELQRARPGIYDAIRETGELSEDTVVALKDAVEQFRAGFEKTGGELLVTEEPGEPLEESDVEAETIKRRPTAPSPADHQ
jgi:F-type H+/Na+-transporting ATPase subunit alpha